MYLRQDRGTSQIRIIKISALRNSLFTPLWVQHPHCHSWTRTKSIHNKVRIYVKSIANAQRGIAKYHSSYLPKSSLTSLFHIFPICLLRNFQLTQMSNFIMPPPVAHFRNHKSRKHFPSSAKLQHHPPSSRMTNKNKRSHLYYKHSFKFQVVIISVRILCNW